MSISLRPYQREAVDAVHRAGVEGCMAPAVGLPTGTGKTVVFSALAQERAELGRTLILAHRDELLRQAADKYREVNPGADVGFVQAGMNDIDHAVVVASVQSLSQPRRLDSFPWRDVKTCVTDEAHHATATTYLRIQERLDPECLHLGVSATLERGDKVGLGAVWKQVVYLKTLQEMIEAGYLVDIRAKAIRLNYNLGQLRTSRGDFVASQVSEVLQATKAYSVAANAYLEHAPGRKAIIFTPTIADAKEMAATFRAAGIPAEHVDGEMEYTERRAALRRFSTGETMVMANAMVLTEGYDEPSVDCIIVARPTKSRPLYVQMVGRGTRLYPGKADLLVLDMMGNDNRVDLQTLPRLFGLRASDVEREGAASVVAKGPLRAAGLYDRSAGVIAGEVDLFERKDVNWLRLADGRWTLSMGSHGRLSLVPDSDGKWSAIAETRVALGQSVPETLGERLDIGYAMGVAEEHLRKNAADQLHLVRKDAPWRKAPASEKQLALLQKLGVPIPENPTKGDAADLIDAAFANKRRPAAA